MTLSLPGGTPEGLNLATGFTVRVPNLLVLRTVGMGIRKLYGAAKRQGFGTFGEWRQAIEYFDNLPRLIERNLERANVESARLYFEAVDRNWRSNRPEWIPLDTDYLASKIAQGLDTRILVATGRALESLKIAQADAKNLYVGVDVVNEDGYPYMVANEVGAHRRPLFAPTLREELPRMRVLYHRALFYAFLGRST